MSKANIGDVIAFKREGEKFEGEVIGVRENSVIVEYGISKHKNEPLRTIVNHKNYKVK
jgi:uncharacterized protein YkvS